MTGMKNGEDIRRYKKIPATVKQWEGNMREKWHENNRVK